MKAFVLLLGVLFLVTGCKPEKTDVADAADPAEVADVANTPASTPEAAAPVSSGNELGIEDHVWVAEDIDGKGIIDNSHVVLTLSEGNASGKSGCNSYRGSYKLSGDQISFGPMASTRMACIAEAMMKQEQDYLTLMSKVTSFQRGRGGALILKTSEDKTIRFMPE